MNPSPRTSLPHQDGPDRPPSARRRRRDHRLRTRAHLQRVRQDGRRDVRDCCIVAALTPAPDARARVAFVVSRRYSPLAVVRNRARRLLREAYRQASPQWAPAWIVLIPRFRLQHARMQDALAALNQAGSTLGLSSP